MSHPELPARWAEVNARQRHRAGDHTQCRPGWCLAARTDQQPAALASKAARTDQPDDVGLADATPTPEPEGGDQS